MKLLKIVTQQSSPEFCRSPTRTEVCISHGHMPTKLYELCVKESNNLPGYSNRNVVTEELDVDLDK